MFEKSATAIEFPKHILQTDRILDIEGSVIELNLIGNNKNNFVVGFRYCIQAGYDSLCGEKVIR